MTDHNTTLSQENAEDSSQVFTFVVDDESTLPIIGVIGSGQMGQGIAEIFWVKKYRVLLCDVNPEALERAYFNLLNRLDRAISKNKLPLEIREQIQDNLMMTSDLSDLSQCDIIIEAIVENLDVKRELISQLNPLMKDTCILASNTSSLSITELSQICARPSHFLGVHFFNPAPIMPLVELVPTATTAPDVLQTLIKIATHVGKMPVTCKDSPGFIVNRLLLPMINHAGRLLDEGIASAKDIDKAMCLGANFPMGPLALADFIGLDVVVSILNTLQTNLKNDEFKPAQCFLKACEQGYLGVKAKRGIFEYAT